MSGESKSFSEISRDTKPGSANIQARNGQMQSHALGLGNGIEVGVVFMLIMVAVWTPQGRINTAVSMVAALCILLLTVHHGYSARELGLARPVAGAAVTLAAGALIAVAIAASGAFLRILGPAHPVPWNRAWQYAVWALAQQFILQSFFYIRLESILGARRAVLAAAVLFALAHLPSPVLTVMSFVGALLFCEIFRRYRNIFPLGLVHAGLGLTLAASLPDRLLHHMRVGIGYLQYHF